MSICGGFAVTFVAALCATGVFLSFRSVFLSDRYPEVVGLRSVSLSTRAGAFGATAGAAGIGISFWIAGAHGVFDLALAAVAGVAADSSRYIVEYRKGIHAYRKSRWEAITLIVCFLAGFGLY